MWDGRGGRGAYKRVNSRKRRGEGEIVREEEGRAMARRGGGGERVKEKEKKGKKLKNSSPLEVFQSMALTNTYCSVPQQSVQRLMYYTS